MKTNDLKSMLLLLLITIVSVVNFFVGFLSEYVICLFMLVILMIAYFTIGYHKDKSIIQKDVTLSIIIRLLLYYLIIYILGLFIGFVRNTYNTSLLSIIKNITPVVILLIISEVTRYILVDRVKNNKFLLVLLCLAFILLTNTINIYNIIKNNYNELNLVKQIGLFIVPSVTCNIFVTYMTSKVGYKPCIIYRFLMELPIYIVPIFPAFGDYIDSVIRITIPVLFIIWLYRCIESQKINKFIIIQKKKIISSFRVIAIISCLIVVYFVSCKFTYRALVIATGSMEPQIRIGDVVIIKTIKHEKMDSLKEGDIIAYSKDGVVVCHRITDIIKSNFEILFETKGDNNPSPDQILVSESQVVGTVIFKIKYIGYPTVIINNLL